MYGIQRSEMCQIKLVLSNFNFFYASRNTARLVMGMLLADLEAAESGSTFIPIGDD